MNKLEIQDIETEIMNQKKYYKTHDKDRDPWLNTKWFILLALLSLFALPKYLHSVEFLCPHCEEEIELNVQMTVADRGWLFPDTWTCGSCGYENYEGIAYCALCGGGR